MEENPKILAFFYTTPITEMIHLCDREPTKESEVLVCIDSFVRHFINNYGVKF